MRKLLVNSFAPCGNTLYQRLQYPFERPVSESFISDGIQVNITPSKPDEFRVEANKFLRSQSVPLIDERIAVFAYGANASPFRFKEKMTAFGQVSNDRLLQVVVMQYVTLPNHQVVWHGRPGRFGNAIAELMHCESDDRVSGHVQYLTSEQLALLHASEGDTYTVAEITVCSIDGQPLNCLAYVANKSHILHDEDDKPIQVRISMKWPSYGNSIICYQAVEFMLSHIELTEMPPMPDPEAYIRYVNITGHTTEDKVRLQNLIQEKLALKGLSKNYQYPSESLRTFGRTDFNFTGAADKKIPIDQLLGRLKPSRRKIMQLAKYLESTGFLPEKAEKKARRELDIIFALHSLANKNPDN